MDSEGDEISISNFKGMMKKMINEIKDKQKQDSKIKENTNKQLNVFNGNAKKQLNELEEYTSRKLSELK
jgi:vacuolar-type H+-ATPase subunit I/STV1